MLGNKPQESASAAAAETLGAPVSSALKTPFIAFGVPAATWLGIAAFWSFLRWTGEAPTYYVGSMVGLRGLLAGPVQFMTMVVLALVFRVALTRTPWTFLVAACAVAGALAIAGDAIGMHFFRLEVHQTAERVWDLVPHLVGPTVLLLILCAQPWAPNKTQQPTGSQSGPAADGQRRWVDPDDRS